MDAGAITADSAVPFPLTDVTKIAANTEHANQVAMITVPSGSLPRLWFGAVSVLLNDSAARAFEGVGIKPEKFEFTEDNLEQLIELSVTGSIGAPRVLRPDNPILYDLSSITPFHISILQLGLYRSLKYAYWEEPLVFVAGNTVDDFCFYYCLSRLRDRIVWVLPSITDRVLASCSPDASRVERAFLSHLHREEFSTQRHGRFACTSMSLNDSQVDSVIEQLNVLGYRRFPEISRAEQIERLVRFPLVAYERDNFQRDIMVQLQNDRSISPFATPKPKHFQPIHPSEHRYIAQLSVAQEGTPKHFYLGSWMVSDHRLLTSGARVGKDGPAYSCPNIGYFGGDIDTVLIRPYLYLPPLGKLVEGIARAQDYECRPSDKGIYADESIAKWGGLPEVAAFLRDNTKRGILEHFVDKSKSEPGKGVYLTDDRRRYLDFDAIRLHVGEGATALIDDLISKHILYRGFIFRCSYCRASGWFSVSEISQEFKCRRCGRTQVYRRANWKMPDEPAWFYKLDELVYQGYQHGMTASLLTLNYLRVSSSETFSFTTDREFWKPDAQKPDVEADLFCAPDGVFTVGEAKTECTLGTSTSEENAKITKYKQLVASLALRQIVFATVRESWSTHTIEKVTAAFGDTPYVRVRFLLGSDLFRGD